MLIPTCSSDLNGLLSAINEKPEDIIHAMPWINKNKSITSQITSFVLESEIQNEQGEIHVWTIFCEQTNEVVGLIGVDSMTHQNGDFNFGYWVKYSFQKQGIATKSILKVLRWLSNVHKSKVIEITVNPQNISGLATCKHILRKIGLDENKFEHSLISHQEDEISYHTFIFPLENINWN